MIAQLAVAAAVYAIDKPYSYRVPEGMQVQPGLRVLVPFGRGNRRSEAVVLALQDTAQRDLKVIERALDDAPILSQAQLQLAAFMKERYFCTFYEAVKAILPAGFWFAEKKTLTLAPGAQDKLPPGMANSDAARLVQLLQEFGGSAPERTLRQQFSSPQVFDTAVQQLLRRKLLRSDAELTQKTGGKTGKIAALAVSAEEAEQFAAKKQTSAPLQAAVLRLLCAIGAGPCREICALTGASMQTVTRLCKLGLLEQQEREVLRSPKQELPPPAEPITLTDEQQTAFDGLSAQMEREKPGAALLYGVTGSGKTAVYVALIQKALDEGRSAMLLVPEIALTPQLLGRMTAHFGKTVAVLHSSLRVGERYDEWRRIARGEARVVVGTRSAVFAPLQKPGLLILDEEQEHTYKSENAPRYHAREIALYRGAKAGALVLFGSATPSIETMYLAKTGVYTLYTLKTRYNGRALPAARLIDMKQELRAGNDLDLSRELEEGVRDAILDGKQSILFLNRRGNSLPRLHGLRRRAAVPALQRPPDLSLRGPPPDVPLLRLLRARARALRQMRRRDEGRRQRHAEGRAGAEGSVPGYGSSAHGCGYRRRLRRPRGDASPLPGRADPDPAWHADGRQGPRFSVRHARRRAGRGYEPLRRQLPRGGDHVFPHHAGRRSLRPRCG